MKLKLISIPFNNILKKNESSYLSYYQIQGTDDSRLETFHIRVLPDIYSAVLHTNYGFCDSSDRVISIITHTLG